jgi:hypothetical protein
MRPSHRQAMAGSALKHGGHRLVAILDGRGDMRLISRSGYNRTELFQAPLSNWPASGARWCSTVRSQCRTVPLVHRAGVRPAATRIESKRVDIA